MKRKFRLPAVIIFLAIVFYVYLSIFHPDISLLIGYLICIPFGLVCLCVILPLGKKRLGQQTTYSLGAWYLRVFLSQCVMGILAMSLGFALFEAAPTFLDGDDALRQLKTNIMPYAFWPWPGFPYLPAVVWGLSLSFFTYCKGRVPFHHNHANLLYKGRYGAFSKAFIEFLVQISTHIGLIVCYVSMIIGIVLGIHLFGWGPLYSESPFLVAVVMVIFFPLLVSNTSKMLIRRLARRHWDLANIGVVATIFLCLVLITVGSEGHKLMGLGLKNIPLQTGHWLKFFPDVSAKERILAVYWGWWLMMTPLLSSYYAFISRGRQVRVFILGIMLLPTCLFVLLKATTLNDFAITLDVYNAGVVLTVNILAFISLYFITRKSVDSRLFVQGFMVSEQPIVGGRQSLNDGGKIHGLSHYLGAFLGGIVLLILLQSASGWYFIGILLSVFAPFLLYKTCGISMIVMIEMLKSQKIKK